MFKKLFFVMISFIGSTNISTASENLTANNPVFFQLEKDGIISYLLGSSHVVPLNDLPLSILKIIDSSTGVAVEHKVLGLDLMLNWIASDNQNAFLDEKYKKY